MSMTAGSAGALILLCLGDLMIVPDVTIVGVGLPSIREDIAFTETSLAWVVNAYLLTFGGFLLIGGRLGDSSVTGAYFGSWPSSECPCGAPRVASGHRHSHVPGVAPHRGPRRQSS